MVRFAWLLVCLALPAHAFVTTRGDRTRWFAVPQVGLGSLSADLPAAECRAALARAVATWASVEGAHLPLPPPVDGPAELTIGFVAGVPELAGVLGSTVTTTEGLAIVRAEVVLNDDFLWTLDGGRGTFRVQATATHELGHALGLAHSPHRDAAMYWHYDPAGVSLTEDDRRGLRFLYGDIQTGGQPCDQCLVPSDCADGLCFQRPGEPGRAHCARPCAGGCGAAEVCVGLVGGGDACVPAGGFCGDGRGLPEGAACWGPDQCGAGRCVVYPGGARCSRLCGGPAECDAGTVCALDPVDMPRACMPPGPAALGEPCTWATDCAEGVCLPEGRCSRWCGACPADWRCAGGVGWRDRPPVCVPRLGDAVADAALDAAADAARDAAADAAPDRAGRDANPAPDGPDGANGPDGPAGADGAAPAGPDGAAPAEAGPDPRTDKAASASAGGCQQGPPTPIGWWIVALVPWLRRLLPLPPPPCGGAGP